MAYYSIAFSLAHIFGHNSGMQLVAALGFDKTWWIITIMTIIGLFFLWMLSRVVKKEKVVA